jgi:copper chaperone NosL
LRVKWGWGESLKGNNKMKKITRITFLILNLILGLTFIFPLWGIYLIAPQYPEGLVMKIWINKISGNLDTINNLNHYIGMKLIKPDSIAELKIMPFILGFFIVFGLLTVILNKRTLLAIWFGALAFAGIDGLVDFYQWLYDYGHNLSPHAAIIIPGMSYQPPLIGTKKLLNFTASSYPHIGGIILILAGITAFALLLIEFKRTTKQKVSISKVQPVLTSIFAILFLISCTAQAEPVNYGNDACYSCKMNIVDNKYGGEIVTAKGKVFKFDSIGCLVEYYKAKKDNGKDKVFVIDLATPGKFIDARKAIFLNSEKLASPMGPNLAAFANNNEIKVVKNAYPGKVLSWEQVLK